MTRYILMNRKPELANIENGRVSTLDLCEGKPKLSLRIADLAERLVITFGNRSAQIFAIEGIEADIDYIDRIEYSFKDTHAKPYYWDAKRQQYGDKLVGYISFNCIEVHEPMPELPTKKSQAGLQTFSDVIGEQVGLCYRFYGNANEIRPSVALTMVVPVVRVPVPAPVTRVSNPTPVARIPVAHIVQYRQTCPKCNGEFPNTRFCPTDGMKIRTLRV